MLLLLSLCQMLGSDSDRTIRFYRPLYVNTHNASIHQIFQGCFMQSLPPLVFSPFRLEFFSTTVNFYSKVLVACARGPLQFQTTPTSVDFRQTWIFRSEDIT